MNVRALALATIQGRRAAAQESEPKNPYNFLREAVEHDAWVDAVAVVQANRKLGRDLKGHPPPPPHLCARDTTKVCNCCSNCRTECVLEAVLVEPQKLLAGVVARGREIIKKVFG